MERIRFDSLTKIYDRRPVVADLNLSVEAGEFCVILGPSGSGKSTIMNMIGGFTPPTSGEIYVDGVATSGLAPYERDLGMMFQGYALFPHLTVHENVAFPLHARGVRDREIRNSVARVLEIVELIGYEQRLPSELSGGQQQRTALARALVFGPRLLLMDEPLAALDRRLRERMQSEIRAIQRKLEITVLYITHDQQEAMMLADKLVVLNQGCAEQVGPPLDVYHRPRTRFVCEFLGDSNILDLNVASIDTKSLLCLTPAGDQIYVEHAARVSVGDRLVVAVRPERIRFGTGCSLERNVLRGRVSDVRDLGAARRFLISVPGLDRSVLISEQGVRGGPARNVGDEAVLTFGVGDTVVISRPARCPSKA